MTSELAKNYAGAHLEGPAKLRAAIDAIEQQIRIVAGLDQITCDELKATLIFYKDYLEIEGAPGIPSLEVRFFLAMCISLAVIFLSFFRKLNT